jgi:Flp pilus assembly protein TadD
MLSGCAPKNKIARGPAPAGQSSMQRQILNAVDAGEGNPRVRTLRERMAAHPENVKVRLELAAEYGRAGYPEVELEHLRLAVERFPDSEDALVDLARALVKSDRPAEAGQRLGEYLAKTDRPSANVLSWAGIAQDGLKNWKNGEVWHRQAVARSPGRDALHNNLGYNLMMQGRKNDAAEEFRRALELNPASETARNNLGLALGDQPAAAIAQFRQTADLAVAHNNLAAYLYEKGDLAGARKELELALDYGKDSPKIMENLRRVAALDGGPIQMPGRAQPSFWKTIARGLKHPFKPHEAGNPSEAGNSAGTADAGR